jgi:hypothetical protein
LSRDGDRLFGRRPLPLWPKVTLHWPDRTFEQPPKELNKSKGEVAGVSQMGTIIGQRIDEFCERLRLKLTNSFNQWIVS